jgi:hypothetical protein
MPSARSRTHTVRVPRVLPWLGLLASALVALPAEARADPPGVDDECGGSVARVAYDPATFLGYTCRDRDCAAHKAGFAWADARGVTDPLACNEAEDPAFGEGCRAFVEDAVTAEQSGFQWARENEVGQRCRCSGAGPRFAAGCEAYVLIQR